MKTTAELCEEARLNLAKKGLKPTPYRLAEETGVSHTLLCSYRSGETVWGNENALKFKDLLPYPPEIILLWAQMEREKSPIVLAVLEATEKRLIAA